MKNKEIIKTVQNSLVNLQSEALENRVIKHFIIGKEINRNGLLVNLNGGIYDGFNKTKAVLFNHNPEIIIGKNNNLHVTSDGILAYTKFREDEYSSNIYNLHRDGILNSWSATYIPKEFSNLEEWLTNDDVPLIIDKWELVEYSSTPIPADVNAIDVIKNNITSNKLLREVEYAEIKMNMDRLIKENTELITLSNELKTNYDKLKQDCDNKIETIINEIKNEINLFKNNLPKDTGTVVKALSKQDVEKIIRNAVNGAVSELTGRIL